MLSLVSATEDANKRAVLSFQWAAFAPASGRAPAGYAAALWADDARTATVTGGDRQAVAGTGVTFSGVPRGLPALLDVSAVDDQGASGPTLSLLITSPSAAPPGLPVPSDGIGAGGGEGEADSEGVMALLRPVYGTADGVKRWARVVSFGDRPGQVSALDVLYFLMVASDDADGEFMARWAVPLTRYRDPATGLFRYPPPLPGLIERKAAGLLLYSRKAALTETESGTATGLMAYADKKIAALAGGLSLPGQTCGRGVLPRVSSPVPRQFSMPGDPAGLAFNPVVGSSDVRFLRPHALSYAGASWRAGAFAGFAGGSGAGSGYGG